MILLGGYKHHIFSFFPIVLHLGYNPKPKRDLQDNTKWMKNIEGKLDNERDKRPMMKISQHLSSFPFFPCHFSRGGLVEYPKIIFCED